MLLMWRLCSFVIGIHLSNLFECAAAKRGGKETSGKREAAIYDT
jgi:hypothetical protein